MKFINISSMTLMVQGDNFTIHTILPGGVIEVNQLNEQIKSLLVKNVLRLVEEKQEKQEAQKKQEKVALSDTKQEVTETQVSESAKIKQEFIQQGKGKDTLSTKKRKR